MSFISLQYALFLSSVFLIYWLSPKKFRKAVLILSSSIFIITKGFADFGLIFFTTVFIFFWGNLLKKKKDKIFLFLGIIFLLIPLIFSKYKIAHAPDILLPLGISFYIFELIHFLIEIYKGNIKNFSFSDLLCFSFFFPARPAGPIKRFKKFSSQLNKIDKINFNFLSLGLWLIVSGLFKKIVIANSMIPFSQLLYSPEKTTNLGLWSAIYAYSIQIWMDFSGYSDIAIGSSLLLGIKVPQNFNWPYLRSNPSSFWKNWHISLTSWIRDYIFIPLGGSRKGLSRTIINVFIIMIAIGLWHGFSLNFLIWGIYHAFGLSFYHTFRHSFNTSYCSSLSRAPRLLIKLLSILLTFQFVTFGWVFFTSSSLRNPILIFEKLFFIKMKENY